MILVDTSAWIELLRNTNHPAHVTLRHHLQRRSSVATTEPIVMELLAGARNDAEMTRLRARLLALPRLSVRGLVDFEAASELYRTCRDVPLPGFVRWCADDLKTVYFEGYMAMKPAAGGDEIIWWFWSETAAGQLLRRVRDRLDASDDPRSKAAAFGIAR